MEDVAKDALGRLEPALRAGGELSAFRSGGGLRVVCVEAGGVLKAYGEHPCAEDALRHAAEDLEAGHREYGDVYGRTETHYLTGSSSASSEIDAWLLRGRDVGARAEGGSFTCELRCLEDQEYPDGLIERVRRTGTAERWEARGFVLETARSKDGQVSTAAVSVPEGRRHHEAFTYRAVRTGRAGTLAGAVEAALRAEPVEDVKPAD